MAQNRHWEQDKEATIYVGNVDERVPKSVIYEIAVQMAPVLNLYMPLDRISQHHQGYGFVEYRTPADADYAAQVLNGVKLYGKSLRVNKASADKQRGADVGAELFVGNLDSLVDEKVLYDTFSRFGPLLGPPKVAREDTGQSKGYGFISYVDFESSDAAVLNMNGQYLLSKEVSVDYAFKRDGKGEKHGDEAERKLAAQAKQRNIVPESQPLPAAFLAAPIRQQQQQQQQQQQLPPPQQQLPPQLQQPYQQQPPQFQNQQHQFQPPHHMGPPQGLGGQQPMSRFAPPPMFDPMGRPLQGSPGAPGMPPTMPPGFRAPPLPQSPLQPQQPQFGGGGGMAPPMLPSGLPARPPQNGGQFGSSNGSNSPADFGPGGFRPPVQNGAPPGPPPPGFATVPPPGFPGAPPPGFMPPPGFVPPPPGFPLAR